MIDEADIEKIQFATNSQWQELFDMIPLMEQTSVFGEWTKEETKKDGFFVPAHCNYAPVVLDFHRKVNALGLILDFDWENWIKGVSLLDDERTNYEKLDVLTLIKLITLIIKSEGLCAGYLLDCFKYGIVLKILKGLKMKIEDVE